MTAFLQRARESLRGARLLAEHGETVGAVSRAYYACFDAARAVLVEVCKLDIVDLKTHSGLIRVFSHYVVEPGLLDRSIGRILGREQQMRLRFDYGDEQASPMEVAATLQDAEDFVAACASLIDTRRGTT